MRIVPFACYLNEAERTQNAKKSNNKVKRQAGTCFHFISDKLGFYSGLRFGVSVGYLFYQANGPCEQTFPEIH